MKINIPLRQFVRVYPYTVRRATFVVLVVFFFIFFRFIFVSFYFLFFHFFSLFFRALCFNNPPILSLSRIDQNSADRINRFERRDSRPNLYTVRIEPSSDSDGKYERKVVCSRFAGGQVGVWRKKGDNGGGQKTTINNEASRGIETLAKRRRGRIALSKAILAASATRRSCYEAEQRRNR